MYMGGTSQTQDGGSMVREAETWDAYSINLNSCRSDSSRGRRGDKTHGT